eukprot:CAMPEP_0113301082 /NCGR_PEP_ID=MMETSP0010_2-20120614/2460_1 /TAXON_ID=216773 ORGANISM="Corethron hystrix, Strain 308" /NCGR_SAMPLE_ID=MMETSP0010_2 /ASSEMBLY_ACC=CAM_ASM_000155 /LENGTH=226 /DNA_ID=CAMNT_0000154647 /DNA_START=48 /DNA_END=725 /DNA_ORIENTATION=+ /assembly_acc=CAM_ASM_000155
MAHLGRCATVVSLTSLAVAVVQCVLATRMQKTDRRLVSSSEAGVLQQFSAAAGIIFAVGSQKLLLNIRADMSDPSAAPASLAGALVIFGFSYLVVTLTSGEDPPSFLFDAVPGGIGRRLTGAMLWIHLSVSFAINSQALCSYVMSEFLDKMDGNNIYEEEDINKRQRQSGWLLLTLWVSTSAYVVANAIPFFDDLVSLVGALTSIPLTLTLPAVIDRRVSRDRAGW